MDSKRAEEGIPRPSRSKASTPPPYNFRELFTGAELAECLAVTGDWVEFDVLLRQQPGMAAEIVRWHCELGDPEASAIADARTRAEAVNRQLG